MKQTNWLKVSLSKVRTTDLILKDIHINLSANSGANRLRQLGWFDFRSYDHPKTDNPVELACKAFLYLSINQNGSWISDFNILSSILTYLDENTTNKANSSSISGLKALLEQHPVVAKTVEDWFQTVYG